MNNLLVSLRMNMEKGFLYQQDTVKGTNPLDNLPGLPEPGGLNIERSAAVPMPIPMSSERVIQKEELTEVREKPAPLSNAQLRYRWWQNEKKLLVDNSRFMKPRNEIELVTSVSGEVPGFSLPSRPIERAGYDWLFILLLVALVLLASVRTIWDKYLGNLFHSAFNYSTSYRMFQEKNTSILQGAFQLDILFYLIFSVFVFQLLDYFGMHFMYRNFYMYLFSLGFVLAYFILKKLIYRFLGVLIEKKTETGEFIFNMENFNRVSGLVLFPVVAVIAFYPYSKIEIPVTLGIFVVAMLYFLLISRGVLILLKKQFSIFYLFLYFCTLEFLPLVLIYKILVV